jgi:4-amino-4-deoxy-L-arabinose transferase-like glycosyltransferase
MDEKRTADRVVVLATATLIICAVVLTGWSFYERWRIRVHLTYVSPLFLEINFFLMVVAVILNRSTLKDLMAGIPKDFRRILLGIAFMGVILVALVAPRTHRVYYDEDIYQHVGQTIAHLGRAMMCNEGLYQYGAYVCVQGDHNKEPNAYPYLLSLAFRVFGVHELVAHLLNNLFFAGSILTVFF